jgi:hypothetical protein
MADGMGHGHVLAEPLPHIPGLPDRVTDLIGRCLAKPAADRPSTAQVQRSLAATAGSDKKPPKKAPDHPARPAPQRGRGVTHTAARAVKRRDAYTPTAPDRPAHRRATARRRGPRWDPRWTRPAHRPSRRARRTGQVGRDRRRTGSHRGVPSRDPDPRDRAAPAAAADQKPRAAADRQGHHRRVHLRDHRWRRRPRRQHQRPSHPVSPTRKDRTHADRRRPANVPAPTERARTSRYTIAGRALRGVPAARRRPPRRPGAQVADRRGRREREGRRVLPETAWCRAGRRHRAWTSRTDRPRRTAAAATTGHRIACTAH